MRSVTFVLACALALIQTAPSARETAPLTLTSARVSLDGTSNVHDFTASSTDVRLTAVELGGTPAGDVFGYVLQAGGLKTFDIVIPAATLTSPREGIDKNMHKALKVAQHPDITFALKALEPAAGAYRATGVLTIAGVSKDVVLELTAERKGSTLAVSGGTDLLMTDYGVAPPKAMMGMIKSSPKVTIRFELVLS
jgi:polyisoprenoid-binding protein YceI